MSDDKRNDRMRRAAWSSGSLCQVYSRSRRRWSNGKVVRVHQDFRVANGEWLEVLYNKTYARKQTQRYDSDIRPNIAYFSRFCKLVVDGFARGVIVAQQQPPTDVLNVCLAYFNDISHRAEWDQDSLCEILSEKSGKWCQGTIKALRRDFIDVCFHFTDLRRFDIPLNSRQMRILRDQQLQRSIADKWSRLGAISVDNDERVLTLRITQHRADPVLIPRMSIYILKLKERLRVLLSVLHEIWMVRGSVAVDPTQPSLFDALQLDDMKYMSESRPANAWAANISTDVHHMLSVDYNSTNQLFCGAMGVDRYGPCVRPLTGPDALSMMHEWALRSSWSKGDQLEVKDRNGQWHPARLMNVLGLGDILQCAVFVYGAVIVQGRLIVGIDRVRSHVARIRRY